MESLAESSFWAERRIVTAATIRRMRDVEFVSELFLLTMHGVLDGAADVIDNYYAEYDEEIPDEDEHRARFDAIVHWLTELQIDWRATRWRNMADLYGLWGAIRMFLAEGQELPDGEESAARLTTFSDTQAELLSENALIKRYPVTSGIDATSQMFGRAPTRSRTGTCS